MDTLKITTQAELDALPRPINANLDLRGWTDRDMDFWRATVKGYVDFRGATVEGYVYFGGATVGGDVDFGGATVKGDVDFREATVKGEKFRPLSERTALLEKVAQAALESPESLDNSNWHTCATTHCIAGWAVHLADGGYELEKRVGPRTAGLLLLGPAAAMHFSDSTGQARQWLRQQPARG